MRTIPGMLIVGGALLAVAAGVGCYRDAAPAGTTNTTSGDRLKAPEQQMGASGPGSNGGTGTSQASGVGMGSTGAGIVDSAGDLRKPNMAKPGTYGPTGIDYADAGK